MNNWIEKVRLQWEFAHRKNNQWTKPKRRRRRIKHGNNLEIVEKNKQILFEFSSSSSSSFIKHQISLIWSATRRQIYFVCLILENDDDFFLYLCVWFLWSQNQTSKIYYYFFLTIILFYHYKFYFSEFSKKRKEKILFSLEYWMIIEKKGEWVLMIMVLFVQYSIFSFFHSFIYIYQFISSMKHRIYLYSCF